MQSVIPLILAILAAVGGVLATLMMLVLLLAGGANSTPERITQIKWLLLAVTAVGIAGLTGGIWAMFARQHWLAAAVGATPIVFVVVLLIVLVKLEW